MLPLSLPTSQSILRIASCVVAKQTDDRFVFFTSLKHPQKVRICDINLQEVDLDYSSMLHLFSSSGGSACDHHVSQVKVYTKRAIFYLNENTV